METDKCIQIRSKILNKVPFKIIQEELKVGPNKIAEISKNMKVHTKNRLIEILKDLDKNLKGKNKSNATYRNLIQEVEAFL